MALVFLFFWLFFKFFNNRKINLYINIYEWKLASSCLCIISLTFWQASFLLLQIMCASWQPQPQSTQFIFIFSAVQLHLHPCPCLVPNQNWPCDVEYLILDMYWSIILNRNKGERGATATWESNYRGRCREENTTNVPSRQYKPTRLADAALWNLSNACCHLQNPFSVNAM